MAKALVFSKVRSSLGLDNCHAFFSGASPLSQDVSEFFLSLDIPIGEIYGMSECSGPHSVSNKNVYRVLRYQAPAALRGHEGEGDQWLEYILSLGITRAPFSSPPSPGLLACHMTFRGRALVELSIMLYDFSWEHLNKCLFTLNKAPKVPKKCSLSSAA